MVINSLWPSYTISDCIVIFISHRLFNKKLVYVVSVKQLLMPWALTLPNFRGSMDKQTPTLVPTAYFSILRPWGYMIHKAVFIIIIIIIFFFDT